MAVTQNDLLAYARRQFHNRADSEATVVVMAVTKAAVRRAARKDHPYFRKQGYLLLPAGHTAGTIHIAAGASVVTGAAVLWSSGMLNWSMKVDDEPKVHLEVGGINTDGTVASLANGVTWPYSAVASGGTYVMYPDNLSLPTDFRRSDDMIEKFALASIEFVADEGLFYRIKMENYSRVGRPAWACLAGNNRIRYWPYDEEAQLISFMYDRWPTAAASGGSTVDFPEAEMDIVYRAIDYEMGIEMHLEPAEMSARLQRFDREQDEVRGAVHAVGNTQIRVGSNERWPKVRQYTIGDDVT